MTADVDSKYVGIPWKLFAQPEQDEAGDCFSVSAHYLKNEFGLDIAFFEELNEREEKIQLGPSLIGLVTRRYRQFKKDFVQVSEPQHGDLVVQMVGGLVLHLGVYIDDDQQLTSTPMKGSAIQKASVVGARYMRHKSFISGDR